MRTFKISGIHHVTGAEKNFTIKALNIYILDEKILNIQWSGYSIFKIKEV